MAITLILLYFLKIFVSFYLFFGFILKILIFLCFFNNTFYDKIT